MKRKKPATSRLLIGSFLAVIATLTGSAQISFGGTPASFQDNTETLRASAPAKVVTIRPNFNPDDERALHLRTHTNLTGKPLTIGRRLSSHIDFARDAARTRLNDGRIVYRLQIELKGARGVLLTYDDFFIPQGGELFIYTPDRSQLLGAYTHETHPTHGRFATEPLSGSSVILEYTPPVSGELPSLLLSSVIHLFATMGLPDPGALHRDEASDEFCQINVNCKEGAEWQAEKAGVVQMYIISKEGASFCTGNLLNNTNEDFRPLILSAAHCESSTNKVQNTPTDRDQWIFTFHYEKPGCSNGRLSLFRGKSMVGCKLLSFLPIAGQSDGLLLELNQAIPRSYRVYYNGWDRRKVLPTKGISLHHPRGDAKKISVYDHAQSPVMDGTWYSGSIIENIKGDKDAHIRFSFSKGATEGGSSGSSLWNQEHLVVGTLSGGTPGCALESENLYGKLAYHWDKYKKEGDPTTQMATYLDPKGDGSAETLKGRWRDEAGYLRPLTPIHDLNIRKEGNLLKVTWAAPSREHIPSGWSLDYNLYRNGAEIAKRISATEFTEPYPTALEGAHGSVVYGVQAHYTYHGEVIDPSDEREAFADCVEEGIYVGDATRTLSPEKKKTSQGVTLSWHHPYNMQEISLFGYPQDPQYSKLDLPHISKIAPEAIDPQYQTIASKFPSEYFTSHNKEVYIHAISYMPTRSAMGNYKTFLRYGNLCNASTTVTQLFDVPEGWQEKTWHTVYLKKPFKVDAQRSLWVGFSTRNEKTDIASIYSVKGTGDNIQQYIDALFSRDLGNHFFGRCATDGYLAIRLHVSDNPEKITPEDDTHIYAGGKRPVPFPIIKEYIVKRNGQKVARVGDALSYTDQEGGENDDYTIEVVYENGEVLPTERVRNDEQPGVYPSQVGEDGLLHLTAPSRVIRFSLYTLEGELVQTWLHPSATLSLEGIAPAPYVVVLETETGLITQRIIR